jgi:hypothetical protein
MDGNKFVILIQKPGQGAGMPVQARDLRLILEMGLNHCYDVIGDLQDQVCLPSVWGETWEEAQDRVQHKLGEAYEMAEFYDRAHAILDWVKGELAAAIPASDEEDDDGL